MAKPLKSTTCYGDIPKRTRNKEIYDGIVKQFGTKVVLNVFLISKKIDDLDGHFKNNPPKGQLKQSRFLDQLPNDPNTFDLTLLHQLLRQGEVCDKIDNDEKLWSDTIEDSVEQENASLESLLYTIIQEKNATVSHGSVDTDFSEQELKDKCVWFTKLCMFTLDKTSKRYKKKKIYKDLVSFKKDMEMEINKRFETERTIDLTPEIERDKFLSVREHICKKYENECKFPIRGWLKSKREVTPNCLYTDVLMEEYFESDETNSKTPREIDSKYFIKEGFSNAGTRAVIISGPYGIGKSTLARHLQDLWVRFSLGKLQEDEAESLEVFDILLYIECKKDKSGLDRFLRNLHGGISDIFPQFDQFYSWLLKMKMLMIIEGTDELGDKSDSFKDEIEIFMKKAKYCKLIATTREINEGIQLTKSIGIENSSAFIIKGIPMNGQLEFAKMAIDILVEDEENKNNLLYKLETHWSVLQDHLGNLLNRPLILSIVSYMWAENPSKVNNLTTLTEFMEGLRESQIEHLVETILRRNPKDWSEEKLRKALNKYLETFDNINLLTYIVDVQVLKEETTILKSTCYELSFLDKDEEDVLGTFLELRKGDKGDPYFSFAHQLFQSYSAAKSIKEAFKLSPIPAGKSKFVDLLKATLSMLKEKTAKIIAKNKIKEYISKSKLTDQDMDIMRDIFLHVTGMISASPGYPQKEYAISLKESLDPSNVDILLLYAAESWNSKNKSYNADIIDVIAFILQNNNAWRIWDSACLKGLLPILKKITPKCVILDFHQNVASLYQLEESLKLIAIQNTDLSLLLHQHYNQQSCEFSDKFLNIITKSKSCKLKEFKGALENSSISLLPSCLTNLQLSIEDTAVQCFYENLHQLNNLKTLKLKVQFHTHVYVEDLPADTFCGDHFELTIVSDVSNANVDCEWLAETTAAMLPRKRSQYTKQLSFFNTTLDVSGMKELLANLKWHKVNISPLSSGKLIVESTETLQDTEYKELNKMVKELGRITLFWYK